MIVIDSSAWIEYFTDSKNADIVEDLFDKEELLTPSLVLIELSCKSAKENWDFKKHLSFIKSKSSVIGVNENIIINCGKIYADERKQKPSFSMIDATILAIARDKDAKILTKDYHFKDYKNAMMIE